MVFFGRREMILVFKVFNLRYVLFIILISMIVPNLSEHFCENVNLLPCYMWGLLEAHSGILSYNVLIIIATAIGIRVSWQRSIFERKLQNSPFWKKITTKNTRSIQIFLQASCEKKKNANYQSVFPRKYNNQKPISKLTALGSEWLSNGWNVMIHSQKNRFIGK